MENTKRRKRLLNILITLILLLAIPAIVVLVQQTQIFVPRAANEPIQFTGPNLINRSNVQKLKLDDQGRATVGLQITSPFGGPAQ